jgi:hypothetical protein
MIDKHIFAPFSSLEQAPPSYHVAAAKSLTQAATSSAKRALVAPLIDAPPQTLRWLCHYYLSITTSILARCRRGLRSHFAGTSRRLHFDEFYFARLMFCRRFDAPPILRAIIYASARRLWPP